MKSRRQFTAPLKDLVRKEIHRRGLELLADPFGDRLVRMLVWRGIDTVIDGGANAGQFGQMLRTSGFTGQIYSVEPLSEAFGRLQAASGGDRKWHVQRAALSDKNGTIDINVSGNSVSSSILPMLGAHSDAAPDSVYVGRETAPSLTVDELVAAHSIDPGRTLLKLDVQGYESTVLAGATASIGDFAAAQFELSFVPLYDGSWLAPQVQEFFDGLGYELWMMDPASMNDPKTGRLMQSDAVFVRK